MRRSLFVLAFFISLAYPALVYFTLDVLRPAVFAVVLLILALLRGWTARRQSGVAVQVLVMLVFSVLLFLQGNVATLRWYPVFMNVGTLLVFGLSLWQTPTVIERLARLTEPNLPESGVRYTRRVTQVWCGFFIVNGSIAAWTALYADWATWTLYNGLIAYLLMGALLGGEWILRQCIRTKI